MTENSLFTLLALVISASAVVVLGWVAGPLGLVDEPDKDLKDHGRAVPIVGGLAVFGTLHVVMAGASVFENAFFWAALGLLLVGLYDDLRTLPALLRLLAATAATVALVFISGLSADLVASSALVVLVVIGVNAVNLLDGADGVAGSAAAVSALGVAVLANNRGADPLPGLILAGAVGGFLMFNWPRARIFLGDGGAYTVGLSLAYFMFLATPAGDAGPGTWLVEFLVAACLFGVFAVDLAVTLLRRGFSGAPLFGGDRSHVYDQLSARGWPPAAVAGAVAGSQVAIVGTILYADSAWRALPAALTAIGVLLAAVTMLWLLGFVTGTGRHETVSVDPHESAPHSAWDS